MLFYDTLDVNLWYYYLLCIKREYVSINLYLIKKTLAGVCSTESRSCTFSMRYVCEYRNKEYVYKFCMHCLGDIADTFLLYFLQ